MPIPFSVVTRFTETQKKKPVRLVQTNKLVLLKNSKVLFIS